MLGTAVPKTAVEEYGDLLAGEDHIGPYGPTTWQSNGKVNSEARAALMQSASKLALGAGVAPAVSTHDS